MGQDSFEARDFPWLISQRREGYCVLRIRSVAGDIPARSLKAVAEVAEKFGSGVVHVTSRQGLELPDIRVDDATAAVAELEAAGIKMGVRGPRVRTIMACPGATVCSNGTVETKRLAALLDEKYCALELPGKLKVGISGCRNDCTRATSQDIGIVGSVVPQWNEENCNDCGSCEGACPSGAITRQASGVYTWHEDKCLYCGVCIKVCPTDGWTVKQKGFSLYLGGSMGKKSRMGCRAPFLLESEEAVEVAVGKVLDFYRRHGRRQERLGETLARLGPEVVWDLVAGDV